jgi:hypothetical protein
MRRRVFIGAAARQENLIHSEERTYRVGMAADDLSHLCARTKLAPTAIAKAMILAPAIETFRERGPVPKKMKYAAIDPVIPAKGQIALIPK